MVNVKPYMAYMDSMGYVLSCFTISSALRFAPFLLHPNEEKRPTYLNNWLTGESVDFGVSRFSWGCFNGHFE